MVIYFIDADYPFIVVDKQGDKIYEKNAMKSSQIFKMVKYVKLDGVKKNIFRIF